MGKKEFEAEYRDLMSDTLNELQTAVLLLAHAQHKITEISNSIQSLSQHVEDFVNEPNVDSTSI